MKYKSQKRIVFGAVLALVFVILVWVVMFLSGYFETPFRIIASVIISAVFIIIVLSILIATNKSEKK